MEHRKLETYKQYGKWYGKYAAFALLAIALIVLCCVRGRVARQAEAPQPTQEERQADRAQTLLDGMTAREKICQLLIVSPEALTADGAAVTELTPELTAALQDYPVGGFLLSTGNLETREQTVQLISGLQGASATRLFICADEEGGQVGRLMYTIGTTKLNSMFSYRALGTQTAYDNAVTLATDLQSCGFNVDFAPVADVWSNPKNTVIGDRAYSDDYDEAAELVAAAVQGFRDSNTICCLKHFPGHGSTETDSHQQAAIVNQTLHKLLQEDLKPFISGMEAGADMVMVGHLTVPSMDEQPASMSYKLVTSLLRRQLTFRGVIVTDGLQMQALGDYTDAEKAVRCLQAGVDVLLEIKDVPGAVAAVEQALADGTLSQEQLDASVLRVLNLKLSHGILPLDDETD
ncbi:MAG: glycoside hydrolase family 3 N-terminal domain-containing protein [Oscillospiraceae bacterium]